MESIPNSQPSIPKILISSQEYDRLKEIEDKYQKLLHGKEKLFDNTSSEFFVKIKLNLLLFA